VSPLLFSPVHLRTTCTAMSNRFIYGSEELFKFSQGHSRKLLVSFFVSKYVQHS